MAEVAILDRYTETGLENNLDASRPISTSERLDRFRATRKEMDHLGRHRQEYAAQIQRLLF